MIKKLIATAALAAALVSPMAGTAGASNGNAYGHGCTLNDGGPQANPGEMLKYLHERDGHFQVTVDQWFDSVADLIDRKCGA